MRRVSPPPCARLVPSLAPRCHPRYGPGAVRPSPTASPARAALPFPPRDQIQASSFLSGKWLQRWFSPQHPSPPGSVTEELQKLPSLPFLRGGAAPGHSPARRKLPSPLKVATFGLTLPCLCPRSETAAALHRSTSTSRVPPWCPRPHGSSTAFLFSARCRPILGIQDTLLRGNSPMEQVGLVTQDFRSPILISRFLYGLNPQFPPTGLSTC